MQVSVTLPVSSAAYGKSFSFMKIINRYLWANMSQNRFTNLTILNIEKNILIDNKIILNIFAQI